MAVSSLRSAHFVGRWEGGTVGGQGAGEMERRGEQGHAPLPASPTAYLPLPMPVPPSPLCHQL